MYFRKLNMNFPPERSGILGPERAAAVLQKAAAFLEQTSFEWVVVDKPIDGSVFVFQLHPSEPLPEDGYGWLDEETSFRTIVGDKEIEVSCRNQGFGHGENIAHMTRRRYRLVQSDLQLMHYLRIHDPSRQTQVHPHLIKTLPRDPATLPSITNNVQPSTMLNSSSYGMGQRGGPGVDTAHLRQLAQRKRTKIKTVQPRIIEDEHEPSGDELDGQISRAVALERYKRNHEFMDMIFSIHSTASLVSPQIVPGEDDPERSLEELKLELERVQGELQSELSRPVSGEL